MRRIGRASRYVPVGRWTAAAVVVLLLQAGALVAQPYVYVANLGSDDVSVLDAAANALATTLPAGDDPNGVAVSPDGTRVYVTNFLSGNLTMIDSSSNAVVATVPVGDGPVGVAVATDGPPPMSPIAAPTRSPWSTWQPLPCARSCRSAKAPTPWPSPRMASPPM